MTGGLALLLAPMMCCDQAFCDIVYRSKGGLDAAERCEQAAQPLAGWHTLAHAQVTVRGPPACQQPFSLRQQVRSDVITATQTPLE